MSSGGTNDVGQDVDADTIIANLKAIYDALYLAGIKVIACTIPPNDDHTTDQLKVNTEVNRSLRYYCQYNNIPLVDFNKYLADSSNNYSSSSFTVDGTHPSQEGASYMARAFIETMGNIVSANPQLNTTNADGDIVANGMFDGDDSGLATDWTCI